MKINTKFIGFRTDEKTGDSFAMFSTVPYMDKITIRVNEYFQVKPEVGKVYAIEVRPFVYQDKKTFEFKAMFGYQVLSEAFI